MIKSHFIKAVIFSLMLLPQISGLNAQNTQLQEVMDSASIEEQFNYIFEKSSRYEEYKVIRETWLNKYRQSLNDTMNSVRNTISDNKKMIAAKNEQIESLNNTMETTRDELKTAIREKNSLMFLGLKMDKTFYNLLMWVLVAALAFGLIFVFLIYKRNKIITREAVAEAKKVQDEYDDYRNRSRLKVEKLRREHLDEILKLKGNK